MNNKKPTKPPQVGQSALTDGLCAVFPADMIARATMTKADEAMVTAGICPKCRTHDLEHKSEGGGFKFSQCKQCKNVFVLSA